MPVHAEKIARRLDEQRPKAFAAADGGMAHRFIKACARVRRHGQQPIKKGINVERDVLHCGGE
jgi:hypothetical protein